MKINKIIELANEYDSLKKNVEYAQFFMDQVEGGRDPLSLHCGGAEMDVHHAYKDEFLLHVRTYTDTLYARMDVIQVLLEGNYAEG